VPEEVSKKKDKEEDKKVGYLTISPHFTIDTPLFR